MPLEEVPPGTVSDGNGLVLFVPTIVDPANPTVAELTATGVVKLTYSITGDGYNHTVTSNSVTANRLTLRNQITYDGTEVDDLSITYVYTNTDADVVRIALPQGTTGYIVERWAVANEVAVAASQIVDVLPINAGLPIKNAPATNTELTRTQRLNVTGKVHRDVEVAGA
jgi:hypothetical protein